MTLIKTVLLAISFSFVGFFAIAQQVTLSAQIQTLKVDADTTKDHYALLIGNGTYRDPSLTDLPSAEHDIRAFRHVLVERMGFSSENIFEIDGTENPTSRDIKRRVVEFTRTISEGSTVILYYAGHGFTLGGRNLNYIVPTGFSTEVDAVDSEEAAELIEDDLISIEDIVQLLQRVKPEGIVLFYNACRNDAFDFAGLATSTIFQGSDDEGGYKPGPISGVHAFFAAGYGQQAIARINKSDTSESAQTLYGRVLTDVLAKYPSMDFDALDKKLHIEVQNILNQSAIPKNKRPVPTYFKRRDAAVLIDETGTCIARGEHDDRSVCSDLFGKPIGSATIKIVERIVKVAETANSGPSTEEVNSDPVIAKKGRDRALSILEKRRLNAIRNGPSDNLPKFLADEVQNLSDFSSTKKLDKISERISNVTNISDIGRDFAAVLQTSLMRQGCSVSRSGSLDESKVTGIFRETSVGAIREYNNVLSAIDSCEPLEELPVARLNQDYGKLPLKFFTGSVINLIKIRNCSKVEPYPICGCGSDTNFVESGRYCNLREEPSPSHDATATIKSQNHVDTETITGTSVNALKLGLEDYGGAFSEVWEGDVIFEK